LTILQNCAKIRENGKGVFNMADYKKMYLEMVNETEKVLEILQNAMLRAEEIYIETDKDNDDEM